MGLEREYQELLASQGSFFPHSTSAALRGLDLRVLPESFLVYKGVNVRPIFEEPYDLLELEKLLAKPELSLETVELLMRLFSLMTKNPDKEVALFAAESINALEVRCIQYVRAIRRSHEAGEEAGGRQLLEALVGMGVLNRGRPVLREFYLREALGALDELWARGGPSIADLPLGVQAHLDLDQPDQAEAMVQSFLERSPQDARLYAQMARIKFSRGDYLQVMALLQFLTGDALTSSEKAIYEFWVGGGRG